MMEKRVKNKLLITLGLLAFTGQTVAAEKFIQLKPKRCVALHKGQTCYQTVNVSLNAHTDRDYCLYTWHEKEPLHCWQGQDEQAVHYDFASSKALVFYVKDQAENDIVASSLFEVVWVYRSKKTNNSSWRLF